jgi:hypothetical protein
MQVILVPYLLLGSVGRGTLKGKPPTNIKILHARFD